MFYNYWLELVSRYPSEILNVPKQYKDYNMLLTAVKINGNLLLGTTTAELKDYNMYLVAVKTTYMLKYVPDEYKTFELLMAIPNLKHHSKYINWELLDQDQIEFLKLKYEI